MSHLFKNGNKKNAAIWLRIREREGKKTGRPLGARKGGKILKMIGGGPYKIIYKYFEMREKKPLV